MQFKRSDRVATAIKEEVSKILLSEIKDPAVGFITITKVSLSDDLAHAKIYFSIYGNDEKKEQSNEALNRANGFIRSELSHRLKLRFTPTLTFLYDDSAAYADHIESLLQKIKEEKK